MTPMAVSADAVAVVHGDEVLVVAADGTLTRRFPHDGYPIYQLAFVGERLVASSSSMFVWEADGLVAAWPSVPHKAMRDAGDARLLIWGDWLADWRNLSTGALETAALPPGPIIDLLPDGTRILGDGFAAPGKPLVLPAGPRRRVFGCRLIGDVGLVACPAVDATCPIDIFHLDGTLFGTLDRCPIRAVGSDSLIVGGPEEVPVWIRPDGTVLPGPSQSVDTIRTDHGVLAWTDDGGVHIRRADGTGADVSWPGPRKQIELPDEPVLLLSGGATLGGGQVTRLVTARDGRPIGTATGDAQARENGTSGSLLHGWLEGVAIDVTAVGPYVDDRAKLRAIVDGARFDEWLARMDTVRVVGTVAQTSVVLFHDADGSFVAAYEKGREIWRVKILVEGIKNAPALLSEDRVVVGRSDGVTAFWVRDGSVVWIDDLVGSADVIVPVHRAAPHPP